jgi:hypothetical protein
VYNGVYIAASLIDFPVMNRSRYCSRPLRLTGVAIQIVVNQIGRGNQFRTQRAQQQITVRILVIPDADVAICIIDMSCARIRFDATRSSTSLGSAWPADAGASGDQAARGPKCSAGKNTATNRQEAPALESVLNWEGRSTHIHMAP